MSKSIAKRSTWFALILAGTLLASTGCGGCSDPSAGENNEGQSCPDGQLEHPITGECETPSRTNARPPSLDMNTQPGDMDAPDGGMALDMGRLPPSDMPVVMVDLSEETRCQAGVDSDGDGLDNDCECNFVPSPLDPGNSDTDGDGLPDGYEDANGDCKTTGTETQPTQADTDSDGLDDGLEVNTPGLNPLRSDSDDDGILDGVEYGTCLDPTNPDTDGDGLTDGDEDVNRDGKIGICPNRMYDPVCAQGEYDPCSDDTDGDGELDSQEVNFLSCRDEFLQAIPAPNVLLNMSEDYQLAIADGAVGADVPGQPAHVYDHSMFDYAGFIASLPRPAGSVELLRDSMIARVQARFPSARLSSNGRRSVSHDGFDSIVNIKIDLGLTGQSNSSRDQALAALANVNNVTHSLNGSFTPSVSNIIMVASVIDRGAGKYLVSAGFAPEGIYDSNNLKTGFLVDDTTSVMSVAKTSEMFENACVSYRVDERPKVDFIWVIDGSGSMTEENAKVKNYASNFAQILGQSNLDWRLGVTSSHCEDIFTDPAISPEVAMFFGSGGGGLGSPCGSLPFGSGALKNGIICAPGFTTNPAQFASCIDQASRQSIVTEYTVTIAAAAIDRALPRQANSPYKLREGAATVIISVTDEFDDLFQQKMGWRDGGNSGEPPNDLSSGIDYAQLDPIVQPFVDYFQRPESNATAFGIYWIPGQSCPGASEAAAGIDRVVNATGGTAGNICDGNLQNTLAQIAAASAGLASGLRLRGTPLPSTLGVRHGDVSTQLLLMPARSREQGWDYDSVTNAVSFKGSDPPQTSDRVVLTYKRWVNSVQECTIDAQCNNGFQKFRCVDGACI